MAKAYKPKPVKKKPVDSVFKLSSSNNKSLEATSRIHSLGHGFICDTEDRGHKTPRGRSGLELVVDASEGFIPLWAKGTMLKWRFRERSMKNFANPEGAKKELRKLFGEALLEWGDAAPVKFKENNDLWDFEIVMRKSNECDGGGCVLASAFFPDGGRHEFVLYPFLFEQDRREQLDTFLHEIGHAFGLRHFFAKLEEADSPSEIFGKHSKFSIMNYGSLSKLTKNDKNDLKKLYQKAWSGELTEINGTPVKLVKPYSALASIPSGAFALTTNITAAAQP